MKKNKKHHVKIGDNVKIIVGSNKGTIGKIISLNKADSTVTIEGVLPRIKYSKDRQGGESKKLELPLNINVSNVMLWDKEANIVSRIGYKTVNNEKKRYFKKSGNLV